MLTGPQGLLLAIIDQAVKDLGEDDQALKRDAKRYFGGPIYRHHMMHLGLNPEMLPVRVAHKGIGAMPPKNGRHC